MKKTHSLIWVKIEDRYYRITEGTGDALTLDDLDNGYIDYIYYDYYETLEDIKNDNIYDGGCILLEEYYQDLGLEKILEKVCEFESLDKNSITILEKGEE